MALFREFIMSEQARLFDRIRRRLLIGAPRSVRQWLIVYSFTRSLQARAIAGKAA
jgi:hypothetical protein